MNPTLFVLLNAGVVILIVVLFLRGKGATPTRLTLRSRAKPEPPKLSGRAAPPVPYQGPPVAKELTVHFEFGGTRFEAHEVLQIPAGASLAHVEKAYREQTVMRPKERDLLTAALVALRKSR